MRLLNTRNAASPHLKPEPGTPGDGTQLGKSPSPGEVTPLHPGGDRAPRPASSVPTQRQFYGTIKLDPVKAKMDFATIVDEVVQQFTSKLGVKATHTQINENQSVTSSKGVWASAHHRLGIGQSRQRFLRLAGSSNPSK